MQSESQPPPLQRLHSDEALSQPKLKSFEKMSTELLKLSLLPKQEGSLKVRPDGTILDGHHRIKVLRGRGVDVDQLPREIILKEDL